MREGGSVLIGGNGVKWGGVFWGCGRLDGREGSREGVAGMVRNGGVFWGYVVLIGVERNEWRKMLGAWYDGFRKSDWKVVTRVPATQGSRDGR